MNPRRLLFFHLLLIIHLAYSTYLYLENDVGISYPGADVPEHAVEIRNPLSIIFTGSTRTSETSYSQYPIASRALTLIRLIQVGLLIVAVARYFISRRRKTGTLLFSLTLTFWLSVAFMTYRLIYGIWQQVYPEWPIVVGFGWDLLYFYLPRTIALIFLISTLQRISSSETTRVHQDLAPLTWMRGFHVLADRLLIIAMASSMFLWFYYSAQTDGFLPYSVPVDILRDWTILSFYVACLMAYLFTEGFFQLSPFKALTGTRVARSATAQAPSWMQIIGRSLCRFIPFNEFSFIFGRGWHDALSGTTLLYTQAESWLSRTSRLVRSFFIVYLCIALWAFIATLVDASLYSTAAAFPQVLLIGMFPIVAALSICYVASLSNLGQNIQAGESTHSPVHFLSALLCWVPVFNYVIPGKILYEASYNIASHDATLAEQYNRHTQFFCRMFGLAYTFTIVGIWSFVAGGSRFNSVFGEVLMIVGTIAWSISAIIYTSQLKSLQMTAVTPDTQHITEI